MEPLYFGVFFRTQRYLQVFNVDNRRNPEYTFDFGEIEPTNSLCWTGKALYSITSEGIVSKWKFLPYSRKYRESVLRLELEQCQDIAYIGNSRFVVSTPESVVNVAWDT
ncbi:Protein F41C3.6 [Aphelenchoides avenae]|nr:Protein F41C3.6 [Aphelenchus avenae]